MRSTVPVKLSNGRVRNGRMASDDSYGLTGAFVCIGPTGASLRIIASDASEPESLGWEHVSVSLHNRCPNWIEMCWVKEMFWEAEETVVQFHPPESQYISNHNYCLHLWRDTNDGHKLPPSIFVGLRSIGDITDKPKAALRAALDAERQNATPD